MSQPRIGPVKIVNSTPPLSPLDSLKSRVKSLEAEVSELKVTIVKLTEKVSTFSDDDR